MVYGGDHSDVPMWDGDMASVSLSAGLHGWETTVCLLSALREDVGCGDIAGDPVNAGRIGWEQVLGGCAQSGYNGR